jgi:hypothetical protein
MQTGFGPALVTSGLPQQQLTQKPPQLGFEDEDENEDEDDFNVDLSP